MHISDHIPSVCRHFVLAAMLIVVLHDAASAQGVNPRVSADSLTFIATCPDPVVLTYDPDSGRYGEEPFSLQATIQNTSGVLLDSVYGICFYDWRLTTPTGAYASMDPPALIRMRIGALTWKDFTVRPGAFPNGDTLRFDMFIYGKKIDTVYCPIEIRIGPWGGHLVPSCNGPFRLQKRPYGYSPNPFRVSLVVTDTSTGTALNPRATILLPPGAYLAPGETATKAFADSALAPGEVDSLAWYVYAELTSTERELDIRFDTYADNAGHVECAHIVRVPPLKPPYFSLDCQAPERLTAGDTTYVENPFTVRVSIANRGNMPASSISAGLILPPGLHIVDTLPAWRPALPDSIGGSDSARVQWLVRADRRFQEDFDLVTVRVASRETDTVKCTRYIVVPPIILQGDKSIAILHPDDKDRWVRNSDQNIRWTSKHVRKARIDYSYDGAVWFNVKDNIDSTDRVVPWRLPNLASRTVFLRVVDKETPMIFAIKTFRIRERVTLSLAPDTIHMGVFPGSAGRDTLVSVTLSPDTAVGWQIIAGNPAVTRVPSTGKGSSVVRLGVDPSSLSKGRHLLRATVDANAANGEQDVFMIAEVGPEITLRAFPINLVFSAYQYDTLPRTDRLQITSVGADSIPWRAGTDVPWLDVTPDHGFTPSVVRVRAKTTSLSRGNHNGSILFDAYTRNSPIRIPVLYTIIKYPELAVPIDTVKFMAAVNKELPRPVSVHISNAGDGQFSFTISDTISWLNVTPTAGSMNTNVILVPITTNLPVGYYHGSLLFQGEFRNSPFYLPVMYRMVTTLGTRQLPVPASVHLDGAYPNPFSTMLVVAVTVSEDAPRSVKLRVYDLLGRVKATLHSGVLEPGKHLFTLAPTGWSPGMYILRMETDGRHTSRPILLAR